MRVDSLTLFAGWFAGALVAEFRLARAPFGPRRAASLSPRVPHVLSARPYRVGLLPASAAISLGVGVSTVVAVLRGQSVGPLAAGLVRHRDRRGRRGAGGQRRVLNRPQRIDEPDVLAADNAVRSRSLHVLAGGGASVVLYCVLGQLAQPNPAGSGMLGQAVAAIAFLGIFAVPLLGYLVATSHWPASRPTGGLAGGRRTLIVEVDTTQPHPHPYEQIRSQLARMIVTGVLPADSHLPSIRQLAADLGLVVNTVARAYRELESGGLVTSRVRHGTTVVHQPTLSEAETVVSSPKRRARTWRRPATRRRHRRNRVRRARAATHAIHRGRSPSDRDKPAEARVRRLGPPRRRRCSPVRTPAAFGLPPRRA